MKVYFIGAGPGDPELVTLKAKRLLSSCPICIYAGSLVNPAVLEHLPASAERHDSAVMSLDEMAVLFENARQRDLDVIRLHSGDPSIYGAIREQMNELDRLGIGYEVIPGVSSFQAAAAALCTELTAPEISQTIILTRTAGRTPMPEDQDLLKLAKSNATLCIFLSAHKIGEVADTLSEPYGSQCPVAVVYHASWPDQLVLRGTLADIGSQADAAGITKTAMIVVGWALSRDIPVSKLYDAGFSHEYRQAKSS
ncbi:cobalt-precorrin-4 C11-methyltransferase [Syntrophotalea carbinolica DSM 2380]|uniref:Cobalt-precorrin-4 C11-methyltransferase n=1 Tax=Syntrophotalea carbinolica (strain DSM 2380 / NBRC 103641 / GraBd1) TaxID=338963 RepID=Q3A7B1_SYNC1|nr:precorrin-4 C(11)-methyltransferase [Syntrophotalea carbinolica]ABA87733.1 cobalt-precorrin-4 C11-methyltransferase [Syntrophotalea carbinolica DSM 2380]